MHIILLILEIVPSSERSSSSGAAPLPNAIKPLLMTKLEEIKVILNDLVPEKKKRNLLEDAMYEDDGAGGFEAEVVMRCEFPMTCVLIVSFRDGANLQTAAVDTWIPRYGTTLPRCRNSSSSREDSCANFRSGHSNGRFSKGNFRLLHM